MAGKRGRPSVYTDAIADEIVKRLSSGETMASICRDDHMPGVTTVWSWGEKDPAFSESIARARVDGFDAIADKALEIADDTLGDPQRDRLRVETRLKLLAKWDPKRYGDKVQVGGDDEAGPIRHEFSWLPPSAS